RAGVGIDREREREQAEPQMLGLLPPSREQDEVMKANKDEETGENDQRDLAQQLVTPLRMNAACEIAICAEDDRSAERRMVGILIGCPADPLHSQRNANPP